MRWIQGGVATWLTISNLDIAVNSQEVPEWGRPYPWGTCKFHRKAIFHSPSGVPPGHYGHSDMTYDTIFLHFCNFLGESPWESCVSQRQSLYLLDLCIHIPYRVPDSVDFFYFITSRMWDVFITMAQHFGSFGDRGLSFNPRCWAKLEQ